MKNRPDTGELIRWLRARADGHEKRVFARFECLKESGFPPENPDLLPVKMLRAAADRLAELQEEGEREQE